MRQLRLNAHLTVFELAVKSGVSIRTINRIEGAQGHVVNALTAQKLLDALGEVLGQKINPNEVEDLQVKR